MILISHRGNINGKQPDKENHPDYIFDALRQGYNVEIDVWFVDGKFKLGHDFPTYDFPFELIEIHARNLWIHCKNINAITQFNIYFDSTSAYINYFWHQKDDVTLTLKGYIWAYPGKQPIKNSIAVLPEINNDDLTQAIGICSDYIKNYKE